MADVSAKEISDGVFNSSTESLNESGLDVNYNTAYDEVRSDKSDVNWLLLDYEVCKSRPNSRLLVNDHPSHIVGSVRQTATEQDWHWWPRRTCRKY